MNSFTKNANKKKDKFLFLFLGVGGRGGWAVDERTVEQAQINLSLQLLPSWGHYNALMYKLFP